MQEYSSSKSTMDELYKIRKNYGIYMGKEIDSFSPSSFITKLMVYVLFHTQLNLQYYL